MAETASGETHLSVGEMTDKTDGSSTLRLHDKVYLAELENVLIKMALDMEDLDPEYSKVVDDHFWELI